MKAVAAFLLVLCCLAAGHAWTCKEPPRLYGAVQIDAGQGKVVARDRNYYAYFLSGTTWQRLGSYGALKHVSVGPAGIWAVDTSNRVYKYVAGNFKLSSGGYLQQVDAGGDGQVVGVNYYAYCLRSTYASVYRGSGSLRWSSQGRIMRYYSCSPLNGCWGVDTSNRIYFTQRITPTTCGISGWVRVSGSAKMVEVGTDGNVFMLGADRRVYQRAGISSSRPYGTSWTKTDLCLPILHVSYDLGNLWVVTTGGSLMQCTH